jgi:hypothetical protein
MKWDCYWTTVVVVGCGRTGKAQLKKRLRKIGGLRDAPCRSTEDMEIHLSCVDPKEKAYMALLDHVGATPNKSTFQADLIEIAAEKARVIILVLDHADTDKDKKAAVNRSRLKEQENFINRSLIPNLEMRSSSELHQKNARNF